MRRMGLVLAPALALLLVAALPGSALAAASPTPATSPAATPAPTPTPTPASAPGPAAAQGSPQPAPVSSTLPAPPAPSPKCPSPAASSTPTPAPGSVDALCAQQSLLDQVRQKLSATMAAGLAEQGQLTQSLQQNQQEQQTLAGAIVENQAQVARLDDEIAARQRRIDDTKARVDVERAELALLARSLYYEPDSFLQRVLQAGDLRKMLEQVGAMTSAADRAQQLQGTLRKDLKALDSEQQKEAADRQTVAQLVAKQAADLQALQKLQSDQQALSAALSQKINATQGELTNVQGQQAALAQKITEELEAEQDQIIAAGNQSIWNQVVLWEQANPIAGSLPPSSGHSAKYRFIWPNPTGVITQGFGPTDLWFEPAFSGFAHFHTGIDVAAPQGTQILAADDGVVALVGSGTTGYGNYVVIAHAGGVTSLYGHLLQPLVQQGQQVIQGQVIGLEGSTGNSTGPHVHFEVRINNQPVDPTPYLPPGAPSDFRG